MQSLSIPNPASDPTRSVPLTPREAFPPRLCDFSRVTIRFSGDAREIYHFKSHGSRPPLEPMVRRYFATDEINVTMSETNIRAL